MVQVTGTHPQLSDRIKKTVTGKKPPKKGK